MEILVSQVYKNYIGGLYFNEDFIEQLFQPMIKHIFIISLLFKLNRHD